MFCVNLRAQGTSCEVLYLKYFLLILLGYFIFWCYKSVTQELACEITIVFSLSQQIRKELKRSSKLVGWPQLWYSSAIDPVSNLITVTYKVTIYKCSQLNWKIKKPLKVSFKNSLFLRNYWCFHGNGPHNWLPLH